jgi:hypothetical protein
MNRFLFPAIFILACTLNRPINGSGVTETLAANSILSFLPFDIEKLSEKALEQDLLNDTFEKSDALHLPEPHMAHHSVPACTLELYSPSGYYKPYDQLLYQATSTTSRPPLQITTAQSIRPNTPIKTQLLSIKESPITKLYFTQKANNEYVQPPTSFENISHYTIATYPANEADTPLSMTPYFTRNLLTPDLLHLGLYVQSTTPRPLSNSISYVSNIMTEGKFTHPVIGLPRRNITPKKDVLPLIDSITSRFGLIPFDITKKRSEHVSSLVCDLTTLMLTAHRAAFHEGATPLLNITPLGDEHHAYPLKTSLLIALCCAQISGAPTALSVVLEDSRDHKDIEWAAKQFCNIFEKARTKKNPTIALIAQLLDEAITLHNCGHRPWSALIQEMQVSSVAKISLDRRKILNNFV